MAKLRKIFIVSVMSITILSMSMLAVPVKVGAAAVAGDLIKMSGLSSVYFLAGDGKRYVFPNENTYFSWYSGFGSVKTIPQSELESYPLGKNVTERPGTKLVKITTDPKVYAVTPGGSLVWVPSETVASTLWGANWAKRVIDVSDAFFTNYTVTSGQVTASAYPAGSLIKYTTSPDVYYIDATGKADKIADEASFLANRFKWEDVVTAPASVVLPALGTAISGAVSTITDTSSGAGGTIGAGTGLTIALSGTTAPSNTLIVGQANANLASFNLTASNDGAVNVTTFKAKRVGISADATLDSVYLYDGTTRLTDSASVSSGYITWNNSAGIITIPAGQTKTITVKADMAGSAGETVGVSVNAAADIVTNGASVSGSFPINGNMMSMAAANLATVAFNATTLPSDTTVDAGESDYTVWKNTVQVGVRYANFNSIRFRQIGSVAATDLKDFKFFVDGIQKGDVAQLGSDNYIYFSFATPVKLDTGSRVLEVRAQVVNGANKTFSFSVQYAVDVSVSDSQYGADIKATNIPATSGTVTVNIGTLNIVKATDSPSGTVTKDASNVSLAKYTVKAYGESIKIEKLHVAVVIGTGSTPEALRNGTLYANGVQIGSTKDINSSTSTSAYTEYTLGSSLIVVPGTPVTLEVKADMYDSLGATNDVANGNKYTIELVGVTNAAQRLSSLGYFAVPGTGTDDKDAGDPILASQLTVTIGTMTLSKQASYGNQNIAVPQVGYKLGSFVLTGNATEPVNLNTVAVDYVASGTFTVAKLTNVYLKYGTKTSSIKSSVSGTSTWSVSEILPINSSETFDVYGDIASDVTTNDSLKTRMQITGLTANSSQSADSGLKDGQLITVAGGNFTVSQDGSTPVAAIVKGNSTVDAAVFKFVTQNDTFVITRLVASTTGANGASDIVQATLKDGTTVLATAPVSFDGTDYVMTFGGLTYAIPANTTKKLTVSLDLGNVGSGAGVSGANVKIGIKSYKYEPLSTGTLTDGTSGVGGGTTGNNLFVYKGIPTITNQTLPSATLAGNSTNSIAKFSVSGDPEISWKQMIFTVATSTNVTTLTNIKLYDSSNTQIPGTAALSGTSLTFTATNEEVVAGSKIYVLKATVNGAGITTNDFISTYINSASNHADPAVYSSLGSFTWSDESANGHDTSTSVDWNNENLVKNLPTDTQVLTK